VELAFEWKLINVSGLSLLTCLYILAESSPISTWVVLIFIPDHRCRCRVLNW